MTFNPLLDTTWPFVYFVQGRLGRAAIITRANWFVCPAIVAKHLCCEQPVKEVQLTSICYVISCVYSSSYGEFLWWIIDRPRSHTPPVPIAISSSQSPLLSVTPVWCMDTANFINVEIPVCYSFSKHIFSAKARESFAIVWIIEEICLENRQHISSPQLSKTLSLSLHTQRQCKMVWGK